jgi:ABC-type multidrug transport system fused ATPase/permease subunit
MDTLQAQTQKKSERMASLLESIDKEKGKKKANLQKEHQAEIDSLTNEILAANATVREFNVAYKLAENKTMLNDAEARIASGNASVNTILYTTYVMFVIAIIALFVVIFVITGMNSPMGLGKILIGVVIIGIIIFAAYQLAPGSQLHPDQYYIERGLDIPAEGDLKMTDTVLYLAYLLVGATAVALITSWVVGALRK